MWLLMLLEAADQSGLAPLRVGDVHRLAFFANCLAPVYDMAPIDGEILKYRRGPFYPEVQWDLDRLTVQAFTNIHDVDYKVDEYGVWLWAQYEISEKAVRAVEHAREAPQAGRMYDFLRETAAAYASLQHGAQETAPFKDATFGDPHVLEQSLLDLGREASNFSVRTAESFDSLVPGAVRLQPRDRLHLYFRYLDRMVAKVAG